MSDENLDVGPASGEPGTSRRAVFAGAGAVGAATVLAACGADSDPGGGDPGDDDPQSGTVLVNVGEVEVGGGVIATSERVVVTQPTEGTFRGFSAVCTHEGCIVSEVNEGVIRCGCHESRYSIEDGSVVQKARTLGPDETQDPLPEVEVAVDGAEVVIA